MATAELNTLREVLNDAAVLAGRLSSAVSSGELPPTCAPAVAAARDCILAAQQCAALVQGIMEDVEGVRGTKAQLTGTQWQP